MCIGGMCIGGMRIGGMRRSALSYHQMVIGLGRGLQRHSILAKDLCKALKEAVRRLQVPLSDVLGGHRTRQAARRHGLEILPRARAR